MLSGFTHSKCFRGSCLTLEINVQFPRQMGCVAVFPIVVFLMSITLSSKMKSEFSIDLSADELYQFLEEDSL